MSSIPEARQMIAEVRGQIEAGTLRKAEAVAKLARAEQMMWREPPAKKRAAPSGKTVDAKMAELIRGFAAAFPNLSEFEIAKRFDLSSQGRVSEALNHKR